MARKPTKTHLRILKQVASNRRRYVPTATALALFDAGLVTCGETISGDLYYDRRKGCYTSKSETLVRINEAARALAATL